LKDGEGIRIGKDGRATRIVADKSKIRVPMIGMDGTPAITTVDAALHRPGFRLEADTKASDAAYADYVGNLEGAWRKPTTDAPAKPAPTAADDRGYSAMCADLESAWRT
jgi:hypothetical protein